MNNSDKTSTMVDLMKTMQEAGLKSMPFQGTDWLTTMADISSEVMNFTAARLKEDVKTQQALMQAKDLAAVQHIHAEFFQKAMDDYAAQTAKLMSMGRALTPGTQDPAKTKG
ncbi:phasin family protein [Pseudorhodobacter aquimaris]|uniref:phasin family protein n=1 Tax=Pseudorhodobacter aquimaris TaxID=687412 RepID=UPI00067B1BF7|nr:phasin family protein [Pseudorhodobacter aquimaris]